MNSKSWVGKSKLKERGLENVHVARNILLWKSCVDCLMDLMLCECSAGFPIPALKGFRHLRWNLKIMNSGEIPRPR